MRTAVPCFRTGRCRRFSFWGAAGAAGLFRGCCIFFGAVAASGREGGCRGSGAPCLFRCGSRPVKGAGTVRRCRAAGIPAPCSSNDWPCSLNDWLSGSNYRPCSCIRCPSRCGGSPSGAVRRPFRCSAARAGVCGLRCGCAFAGHPAGKEKSPCGKGKRRFRQGEGFRRDGGMRQGQGKERCCRSPRRGRAARPVPGGEAPSSAGAIR